MLNFLSGRSCPITSPRVLLCTFTVAACIAALSAVTIHDFGDHYRPGEIGRLAPHHAVLEQPPDATIDKGRPNSRIQAKLFLLTTAANRVRPLIRFEPTPLLSLYRRLLRLKLGLRSDSDGEPSVQFV